MAFERCPTFETRGVIEIDPEAVRTYSANFDVPWHFGDVFAAPVDEIPDFDILVAGFPCQPFSVAGKKAGFSDVTRGTVFQAIMRIVEARKPRALFFENVEGLLRHDEGRTFETICASIRSAGYGMKYAVLNAANFGLAQNRPRTFIFASTSPEEVEKFGFPEGNDDSGKLGDVLEPDVDVKYYISRGYLASMIAHRKKHEALGHGFGYVVRERSGKAGTLVVGGSGHERNLVVDKPKYVEGIDDKDPKQKNVLGIRKMTVREWARLQGFPEEFVFPVSRTRAYSQIANSVAVPVVSAIAEKIAEVTRWG